jgi:hypothetical protein
MYNIFYQIPRSLTSVLNCTRSPKMVLERKNADTSPFF